MFCNIFDMIVHGSSLSGGFNMCIAIANFPLILLPFQLNSTKCAIHMFAAGSVQLFSQAANRPFVSTHTSTANLDIEVFILALLQTFQATHRGGD